MEPLWKKNSESTHAKDNFVIANILNPDEAPLYRTYNRNH